MESEKVIEIIKGKASKGFSLLKAQRDLEKIKIKAGQKVTQARAEAEALRLQKENVTPQLVKLRQIEASIKAIEKWDGHMPKVTSGAVPFVDVKSFEKE